MSARREKAAGEGTAGGSGTSQHDVTKAAQGGPMTGSDCIVKLLSRLEGVKPAGAGRWSALCPAHDDRSPSLSIRDTGDRVLVHCFSGCCSEDVLTAVGLTWKDLYPDRWDAAYAAATCGRVSRSDVRRIERTIDPMDTERMILKLVAADIRAGKELSVEDLARVEVAKLRLEAAREASA